MLRRRRRPANQPASQLSASPSLSLSLSLPHCFSPFPAARCARSLPTRLWRGRRGAGVRGAPPPHVLASLSRESRQVVDAALKSVTQRGVPQRGRRRAVAARRGQKITRSSQETDEPWRYLVIWVLCEIVQRRPQFQRDGWQVNLFKNRARRGRETYSIKTYCCLTKWLRNRRYKWQIQ